MDKMTITAFEQESSDIGAIASCSFAEKLNKSGLYESELDVIENIDSLIDEVRGWLQKNEYNQAEVLLDLMLDHRRNDLKRYRHDDTTPKELHEIIQAIQCINAIENGLPINDPEGVLNIIFAHDLGEDYYQSPKMIEDHLRENGIKDERAIKSFLNSFIAISKYTSEEEKKK